MRSIIQSIVCVIGLLVTSVSMASQPAILVVGDSLSAGYGMMMEQSWPRLLQNRLELHGFGHQVVNSSITGDTSQGGLARLPRQLDRHKPEIVIIELGGNDGLRGLSLQQTRANLASMIQLSQQNGAQVVLAGIQIPPNYGMRYTGIFKKMYPELATEFEAELVPFLMEGVALDSSLMQSDGIHPNADAQPVLLDNVWHVLQPMLD